MVQIDTRKSYKLTDITDNNGTSKINERKIYQQVIGGKVRRLLLEEIPGREQQSILRMEIQTRYGNSLDFHTSLVCDIVEENGELTVKTRNSVYHFEETQDFSDELKIPPAAWKECIELYLWNVDDRFCQGYYYDAEGKAIELECVVHSGVTAESCLIITQGETCGKMIVCRYFPQKNGEIQFYDTLYGQQDYSFPILIHNEGSESLFISFQWFGVQTEIKPGEEKTFRPFCGS